MVVDQQSLLEDKDRLEELRRSYDGEARLNESFIVLTVGASLIASLGLVADNNAVIIGAMVVAPWILPLRVAVFAILIGQARLLSRSLITLVAGAGITLILSMGLGLIARSQGLLVVEALPEQIVARLEPNTFDLGIALAAGAIATYAKVNPGAVSRYFRHAVRRRIRATPGRRVRWSSAPERGRASLRKIFLLL